MWNKNFICISLSAVCVALAFIGIEASKNTPSSKTRLPAQEVNEAEAVRFLDTRTANWLTTSISQRHNGSGRCLSCHTILSYSLTRPQYGDSDTLKMLKKLIAERVKEFQISGVSGPWYAPFVEGSLATETIINSMSLISMDLARGEGMTDLTETSLAQMWSRQVSSGVNFGGFEWLDGYALAPLESEKAGYWGSALVAGTVADIDGYADRNDVRENIIKLKKYLANNFDEQSLHNKLMALEANKKLGGNFIPASKVTATLNEVLGLAESNGGWDLHKLLGRRGIGAPDNYATAIVIKAFVQLEHHHSPKIKKAVDWLRTRQIKTATSMPGAPSDSCNSLIGSFLGHSVNHGRDTLFMTDLATAFSMKALKMATNVGL